MKALIGITSYYLKTEEIKGSSFVTDRILTSYPQYAECVEKAGAVPVNLPLLSDMRIIKELVSKMDGFIFCGGEDVLIRSLTDLDNVDETNRRDAFEMKLLSEVIAEGKPLLAICRGMQLLNVYYCGTLLNDIAELGEQYLEHLRGDVPDKGVHKIIVKEKSEWEKIFGQNYQVNSIHHQAIDNIAPELEVVAWAEDGIIEMVENRNYPFMVGVQWHPEMLKPFNKELFTTFTDAALSNKR